MEGRGRRRREVTWQVGTKAIWTQSIHLLYFSYFWPEFPPELSLLQTPTWDYSEFHWRPRALTKTRKIIFEDESTSSLQGKWLLNPCTQTTGCRPALQNLLYSSSNHHRRSAWTKTSWSNLKRPAITHNGAKPEVKPVFFFFSEQTQPILLHRCPLKTDQQGPTTTNSCGTLLGAPFGSFMKSTSSLVINKPSCWSCGEGQCWYLEQQTICVLWALKGGDLTYLLPESEMQSPFWISKQWPGR